MNKQLQEQDDRIPVAVGPHQQVVYAISAKPKPAPTVGERLALAVFMAIWPLLLAGFIAITG